VNRESLVSLTTTDAAAANAGHPLRVESGHDE
jgi:hypothetical protein